MRSSQATRRVACPLAQEQLASLRPETVFFTADESRSLKLGGYFGLVSHEEGDQLTQYRAPELLDLLEDPEPELAVATGYSDAWDTWSVGCLAFELLGGRSPFGRATEAETRTAVQRGEIPGFPPRFSPEAQSFIRKALVRPLRRAGQGLWAEPDPRSD